MRPIFLFSCPASSWLEYGYRVDRRSGGVMKTKRANGEHKLPPIALATCLGKLFQVSVVQNPQAHRDDADLVNGIGHARVPRGDDVVPSVAAQHRDAALVEQWQTRRLAG